MVEPLDIAHPHQALVDRQDAVFRQIALMFKDVHRLPAVREVIGIKEIDAIFGQASLLAEGLSILPIDLQYIQEAKLDATMTYRDEVSSKMDVVRELAASPPSPEITTQLKNLVMHMVPPPDPYLSDGSVAQALDVTRAPLKLIHVWMWMKDAATGWLVLVDYNVFWVKYVYLS